MRNYTGKIETFPSLNPLSISKFFIFICLSLIHLPSTLSSQVHVQSTINVWPKPRRFEWPQPLATYISQTFSINSPFLEPLNAAVYRYGRLIKEEHHYHLNEPSVYISSSAPALESLTIAIKDLNAPLQHGVNETYEITIYNTEETAYLIAETIWGAMRGLETFSQLVWGVPAIVPVGLYVWDSPMFAHRGLMLDTSRNYYEVRDILRTITAMSANKMNVFHWHITDAQSFPLMVPSEPDLAVEGSYGPEMIYTPDDVATIVEFGIEHGVRVIPEIDSPGHTGSWARAYPEIVSCANMFWWPAGTEWRDRLASEPGTGQLNPLKRRTYQVFKHIIRHVISLFPEKFYHGGADEVVPGCWNADPTIRSNLSNGGTPSQLLETFVNSTLPYIVSHNRTVVYWEDVLLDDTVKVDPSFLPKEHTILQTWHNGTNNTKRIVEAGYRVIVSSSEFYYLDCGHGGFVGNDSRYDHQPNDSSGNRMSWCDPFKTWQTIYNYNITYGLTEEEAKLVLGGEVALWSEQADHTVLDARIWPRTSAMAEALWSGNTDENGTKRYAEATDRLNEWRYRMLKRGINAEPIQPLWCVKNPGMCNTVHSS